MERPFEVAVEIGIEYDVGSPPDSDLDAFVVANPDEASYMESWATQEGPSDGVIAASTTALYPPFTSILRRQVFCVLSFATLGTTTVRWNGENFPVGRVFLTTDPGWAASGVVLATPGEGSWFACEGEVEEDFRDWRPGSNSSNAL